jgi:hypothetical protein
MRNFSFRICGFYKGLYFSDTFHFLDMNFSTILFPMTVLNTQFQQQYAKLSFTESKSKAVPLLAMQALRGRGKSSTDV